jgi:hypothetical protein
VTDPATLADYHRRLLSDRRRFEVLRAALAEVVVPGESVVADVGAGTGVLGLQAALLGARRVVLYEREPVVAAWAEEFVAAQGLTDRVCVVPEDVRYVLDPEPVDVVVSETLGNIGPDEGIVALLDDARRRYLRPGGRSLPETLELLVAPVFSPSLHHELVGWATEEWLPVDVGGLCDLVLGNAYVRRLTPQNLLAGFAGRVWTAYDFRRDGPGPRTGVVVWPVPGSFVVHGLVHYWRAGFGERFLATGPDDPPTHWEQVFLPLPEPLALPSGGRLEVRLTGDFDGGIEPFGEGSGIAFEWVVRVYEAGGGACGGWSCGVGVPPVRLDFQKA